MDSEQLTRRLDVDGRVTALSRNLAAPTEDGTVRIAAGTAEGRILVWRWRAGRFLGSPQRVATEVRIDGLTFAEAAVASDGAGFESIRGRVDWNRAANGWELQVDDLFVERQSRSWQSPVVRVEHDPGIERGESTWLVEADHLRLQDLMVGLPLMPEGPLRQDLRRKAGNNYGN